MAHYATVAPVCGVLGVELFFVLSGFLIGGILYRTILGQERLTLFDVTRFWLRRWMRTLPNYYLFLGLFTALASFTQDKLSWAVFWQYPLFLQNLFKPPVTFYEISWILAVEEWFYLLFPLLFFVVYVASGRQPAAKRAIFLSCAVFLAIFSLGLRVMTGTSIGWSSGMRMIVVYRFDALMFGVILAVINLESERWWRRVQALLPVGAVLLVAGTIIGQRAFPDASPLLPAAWLMTIIPLGFALILPCLTRLKSPGRLGGMIVAAARRDQHQRGQKHADPFGG